MADAAIKLRRLAALLFLTVLIGITAFVLRGPTASDALKKVILPELEAASGMRVTA